ncbi:hypothetical protein AHAS_Ahas12G0102600 [Arachis hypogaea]
MPEGKLLVGLSWQPQLLIPSSSKAADACHNKPQSEASNSSLWKPNTELVDGIFVPPNDPRKLNKLLRKQAKDTAGKDWFDMPTQTITPELQTDLKLLKLRSALDPKWHYKKGDSKSKALPKYFQVGTVVEDASEFYSERLTKKERKATIADELLSDQKLAAYRSERKLLSHPSLTAVEFDYHHRHRPQRPSSGNSNTLVVRSALERQPRGHPACTARESLWFLCLMSTSQVEGVSSVVALPPPSPRRSSLMECVVAEPVDCVPSPGGNEISSNSNENIVEPLVIDHVQMTKNIAQEFVNDDDETALLHAALEETRAKLSEHRAKKRSVSVAENHTSIGSQHSNVLGVVDIQAPPLVTTKGRSKRMRMFNLTVN